MNTEEREYRGTYLIKIRKDGRIRIPADLKWNHGDWLELTAYGFKDSIFITHIRNIHEVNTQRCMCCGRNYPVKKEPLSVSMQKRARAKASATASISTRSRMGKRDDKMKKQRMPPIKEGDYWIGAPGGIDYTRMHGTDIVMPIKEIGAKKDE